MSAVKEHLGEESYDQHEFGTAWWLERAMCPAHRKAYKRIADIGAQFCPRLPRHIVDYACGPGLLVRELLKRFPVSFISAMDESAAAIDAIPEVLQQSGFSDYQPRTDLRRQVLPAFDIVSKKADIVFFLFPDFRGGATASIVKHWKKQLPQDWEACKAFRRYLKKTQGEHDFEPSPTADVFYKRLVMRNHQNMIKKGGIVVRVDYGQCERRETDRTMLKEMAWVEGCEKPPKDWPDELRQDQAPFKLIHDQYIRAKAVMNDVYLQTGDPDDKDGGYMVSVLQAR